MHALAGELRRLRAHIGRPLADLTAEAERVLGLDIEVAARPGVDPVAARADLDAFTDVADAFTGEGAEPTLGAFLAYLTAAQQEEFGLETGRVGESDSVKLLTVHAAKGLQWPAVFVPGLAVGERSQVFPARPRVSTRWTDNPRLIPFGLRGDAGDLPELPRPRRRLARGLRRGVRGQGPVRGAPADVRGGHPGGVLAGLLGLLVGRGRQQPPGTLAVPRGGPQVRRGPGHRRGPPSRSPTRRTRCSPPWTRPTGRSPRRAAATRPSARPPPWCEAAACRRGTTPQDPPAHGGAARPPYPPGTAELAEAWDRDAGLLLAERAQRRGDGATQVPLPARLSVSSLVSLARDPAELARQVRRPMPRPPARQARRGTAFHQWLEQRYGQQLLIDDNALFGPDGDGTRRRPATATSPRSGRGSSTASGPSAGRRRSRCRSRPWSATGWSAAGSTRCSPTRPGAATTWSTGRPAGRPGSEAERHAVSVQLAAYRLAWAALAGVPVAQVRAAFYYVAHDQTVRPADLLDEAGLAALIEQVPAEDCLDVVPGVLREQHGLGPGLQRLEHVRHVARVRM